MTQISCFGSVVALNDGVTCRGCAYLDKCKIAVGSKKQAFIGALDEYYDMSGNPMVLPWLTKADRKKIKSHERTVEASKVAARQFKRSDALALLKRNIDVSHHSYIEEMLVDNVNMLKLRPVDFAHHSHAFGVIHRRLSNSKWALRSQLVEDLTSNHHYSITRARKEIKAAGKTLAVFRAASRFGHLLERK